MNATSWRHDSNGHLYICDHAGQVSNTSDIARRWLITGIQEFKMATNKPEVEITFERCRCSAIPTSTPIFSVMPDSDYRHCPTSAYYRKSRWLTSKPEVCGRHMNSAFPVTSGSVTVASGMVTNVEGCKLILFDSYFHF